MAIEINGRFIAKSHLKRAGWNEDRSTS